MADSYVCSKAKIKCSCGDRISTLTVFPDRTIWLTGEPQANISDHVPMRNIAPFGRCHTMAYPATGAATAAAHGKLTPMPCVPNTPFPWMGGKNDVLLKGHPALLKSSTCKCVWGGTITITFDGQKTGTYGDLEQEKVATYNDLNATAESQLSSEEILDGIQLVLDAAGFVPGFGAIPDLLNAGISALRGNWNEAGMSLLAALPVIGDAAAAAKLAQKGIKAAKTTKALESTSKITDKYQRRARLSKLSNEFVDKNITMDRVMSMGLSKNDATFFMKKVRYARRNTASDFYTKHGMSQFKVESHLNGIDYNRPVIVSQIPPKGSDSITLYQYRRLSDSGNKHLTGNYFTKNPDVRADNLGIASIYSNKKGQILVKDKASFTLQNPRPCLISTSRKIKDTWSVQNRMISTSGGAEQIFIPFKRWMIK